MNNPLLDFSALPQFDKIEASHVIPALETVLQRARDCIVILEKVEQPTWKNFALVMEDIDEQTNRMWSPVGHLNGVKDSAELREAYEQGISLLTEYGTEVGQNLALYQQYKKIKNGDDFSSLSAAQKKIIENNLLDFQLSGAELEEQDKQRFADISQRLSELSNQFGRNVLDATQAWSMLIIDKNKLGGLPESSLKMAEQLAEQEAQQSDKREDKPSGKAAWLFNLQIPSYLAIMKYAENPELREKMYRAYVMRASELSETSSEFDNAPLIDEILALRLEKANLLGYKHYADYSLVRKMARSTEEVLGFLDELTQAAKPIAKNELAKLENFAQEHFQCEKLEPWDLSFYSEKLREQRYSFTDEDIKPYFPAPVVLKGMFNIVTRLFQINIQANNDMATWHESVRCFDVFNQAGELIGQFYADLYVRKDKRGGAWMDTCVHRRKLTTDGGVKIQTPVAFLTCNFSPPIANDPALLTHDEVETLFHEFGHTLHHLLTQVDEMGVAGINGVAWDAVELPSQFLENWCWQDESLALIAKHYQTNELLPAALLKKMRAAKNFQSGMQTLRQVEFSLFDILLHSANSTDSESKSVQQVIDDVRQQVAVINAPSYNRFQNSFGHIFAGGYAAGYYSYKWAEVLSADAFGRFEEEGIFNSQIGQDFLSSILQRGGVDDPNDLFFEFRKRKPSIDSLLRHTGIIS